MATASNVQTVVDELLIPLHQPKILTSRGAQYYPNGPNDRYAARMPHRLWSDLTEVPSPGILDAELGVRFEHSRCGQAGTQQGNDNGYRHGLDINSDGVIDRLDQQLLEAETGNVYRANFSESGYFGMNWLSPGWTGRSEFDWNTGQLYVCSYDYGAGYKPDSGIIHLFEPPPAGQPLYVEYFHDVPAAEGKDNIKLYLYRS